MQRTILVLLLMLSMSVAWAESASEQSSRLTPIPAASSLTLEKLWQADNLRTPESVLFYQDEEEAFLFVSEIEGDHSTADGKGGIAKLSLTGEIIDRNWVRGLNAPKGLTYLDDKLYVTDMTEVVEISIATGEILRKIPVPGAVFLNDASINARGEVFVSDTRTNKIHRIIDGKVETYLEDMVSANGLKAIGSNLVVAAGDTLWLVDAELKRYQLARGFAAAADGVEVTAPGEFLVTCWEGLVYYVHSDGRVELLLDSRDKKINTADLGYDIERKIAYIPNFFHNSVTAYQLH